MMGDTADGINGEGARLKKDDMRFSIRFNSADPRHRKAAQLLNAAGRRKATIVADALWEYELRHGANWLTGGAGSESEDSEAVKVDILGRENTGNNGMLSNSILQAIGQFRDE